MPITKMSVSSWDYVIFAACLAVSAGIGVYYRFAGGRQSTTEEFLMANRQMSLVPVSMSLLATFISAITLLGTPTEIFVNGTQYVILAISNVVMIPIAAYLYIPVFYRLRLTSAYEYLERRFNKATRTAATLIYSAEMTIYMSIVLYAPCLAVSAVTGINVWLLIIVAGAICVFYTSLGGLKAVIWTDTFQVTIMYAGLILALILGSSAVDGGLSGAWRLAAERGRIELDNLDPSPFERHTIWGLGIGGTVVWLGIYSVNQAAVQRCLACPTLRQAQIAMWINAPGLALFILLTSTLGLLIFARYADCDPLGSGILSAPDQLLPLFVMEALEAQVGLTGLFVSCVCCGSLSTISSCLNSLAAVMLEDVIRPYVLPSIDDATATRVSKALIVVFGVVCVALTWVASRLGGILVASLTFNSALGGPILGVFTLGLFVPFANAAGAMAGLATSLGVSLWIALGSMTNPPPRSTLCQSTTNCSAFNATINFNASAVPSMRCHQVLLEPEAEEYEGLWLYRISYIWYSTISVLVVLIVGIIVTLVSGRRRWASPGAHLVSPGIARFVATKEEIKVDVDKQEKTATENSAF